MSIDDAVKDARGDSYVLKHKHLSLDLKTVGINIRRIRKALGYSQVKTANLIGCNRASLSKFETGVGGLSVTKMIDIFDKLGYVVEFSLKKKTR